MIFDWNDRFIQKGLAYYTYQVVLILTTLTQKDLSAKKDRILVSVKQKFL